MQHVGFVLICYGAADALGSITCGSVVKIVGRVPIFIFGALLNAALIITLFLWRPDPDNAVVFFVIAAFWGLSDSIWQTQINCKYSLNFSGLIITILLIFVNHSVLRRYLCRFRGGCIQQLPTLGEFRLRHSLCVQLCIMCQRETLGACRSSHCRNGWLFDN